MRLQKALIQQMFETEETKELSPESNVGRLEDKTVLIRRSWHLVMTNSRLVM